MKKQKWIIPLVISIVFIIGIGLITYHVLSDKNKLTSEERTWINNNINNVFNIYVIKDENLFSKDGNGVFNIFLNDFSKEYNLKLNIITFDNSENVSGLMLNKTNNINENLNVFYKDHYVLLSKKKETFSTNKELENKIIGVLNSELEYIKGYLKEENISYNGFESDTELFASLNTNVDYIAVERIKYLNNILANNLEIVYHLNDVNTYYILNNDNSLLGSIINKYFIKWSKNIDKYLKKQEFSLFTKTLNISDTEVDKLLSVDYRYAFINNSPYEVIMSGKYGGIIAEYLKEFSEFSGVYFDITKYKNINKLVKAINKNKVDIYFSFNDNIQSNYIETQNGIRSSLAILTRRDNNNIINSIYGLQGEEVYVENNSNLHKYLKGIGNIKINTYETNNELFKLNKKDTIIVMDNYIFDYYSNSKLNNYVVKYETFINDYYTFKIKGEYSTLATLINKYINYLDESTMINKGINSHEETIKNGNILNSIAKFLILSILTVLIVGLFIYRNTKKIRIARKIRRDDKIRFIDDLTCLKNRSYLSDSIKAWNNNTIYPQTIIVADLNKLQEINEKYGVSEGDKQIRAFANALIKTQLDNSDLMRSDGNEFVIYAVGYSQKQIVNYIHKVSKELKRLPYNYGAEFGYSIILNNLKTVEDALNEATIEMKKKK